MPKLTIKHDVRKLPRKLTVADLTQGDTFTCPNYDNDAVYVRMSDKTEDNEEMDRETGKAFNTETSAVEYIDLKEPIRQVEALMTYTQL